MDDGTVPMKNLMLMDFGVLKQELRIFKKTHFVVTRCQVKGLLIFQMFQLQAQSELLGIFPKSSQDLNLRCAQ